MWYVYVYQEGNWKELNAFDNIKEATDLYNEIVASGCKAKIDKK